MDSEWIGICIMILCLIVMAKDHFEKKHLRKTIDRQQDTISRLINREPVTYAETGQQPRKPIKERYAAWGSQMVDLDEEDNA